MSRKMSILSFCLSKGRGMGLERFLEDYDEPQIGSKNIVPDSDLHAPLSLASTSSLNADEERSGQSELKNPEMHSKTIADKLDGMVELKKSESLQFLPPLSVITNEQKSIPRSVSPELTETVCSEVSSHIQALSMGSSGEGQRLIVKAEMRKLEEAVEGRKLDPVASSTDKKLPTEPPTVSSKKRHHHHHRRHRHHHHHRPHMSQLDLILMRALKVMRGNTLEEFLRIHQRPDVQRIPRSPPPPPPRQNIEFRMGMTSPIHRGYINSEGKIITLDIISEPGADYSSVQIRQKVSSGST